jgi:phage gp46-like protein
MQKDIALNNPNGYYDISFTNGDFTLTSGFDTAILMSLFTDKRAASFEVPRVEMRRGWCGNLLNNYANYEIGSKLWLLDQERKTPNIANLSESYTYDCLKWFLDDDLATNIDVSSQLDETGIVIAVIIKYSQNILYKNAFSLWQNTTTIT